MNLARNAYCGLVPPCKDCKKRFVGCHDRFNDYLNWNKELKTAKQKEKQYNEENMLSYSKYGNHVSAVFKKRGG